MAWHFKRFSQDSTLAAAETRARDAKRGLWAEADPIPPWSYRPSGVMAQAVRADAGTDAFRGSVSSHVFHATTCRYAACVSCTATFRTRDAALAAGFRPCGICHP